MQELSCPSCAAQLVIEHDKLVLSYQTEEIVAAEQVKIDTAASSGQVVETIIADATENVSVEKKDDAIVSDTSSTLSEASSTEPA